jgi:putative peptidoglycan lipid II flippase
MWGNVINWVVNIGLNIALMRVMGVAGIALATSIVYLVNLIFLTVMVRRRLKGR